MKKLLLFLLCPFFLFGQTQIGQDINGDIIGNNADRIVNLSRDGKVLAVASPSDDGVVESSGVVRVYENISGTWMKIGDDIEGDFKTGLFGSSVSLNSDGSIIAIGSPGDNKGDYPGIVSIYKKIDGNWVQIGDNIVGDFNGNKFGNSLSLNSEGNIVAIGIPRYYENDSLFGEIKIFENINGVWTQIGNTIKGKGVFGILSCSISLNSDGSTVAIGEPESDVNYSGQVRVYKNINNTWTQIGENINGSFGTHLGSSVSLSGDANTLVIRNLDKFKVYSYENDEWNLINDININSNSRIYSHTNSTLTTVSVNFDGTVLAFGEASYINNNAEFSGVVKIYKKSTISSSYTQIGSNIYGVMSNDYFGISVSLNDDGTRVAIGDKSNSINGVLSDVRVYENINNVWIQIGNINEGNIRGSSIGNSVSLSSDGSIMAIGTSNGDGNGFRSGGVKIYKNTNGAWSQIGNEITGDNTTDYTGIAISLNSDGSIITIGATGVDEGNGVSSGSVKVYKFTNDSWIQIGSTIYGKNAFHLFGLSVSLSSDGSILAIGSGNGIEIEVYRNIDNDWIKISSEIKTNEPRDNFGRSVSLNSDGTVIAVGEIGSNFSNDPLGQFVGKVYIYKNKDGNWVQVGTTINGKKEREIFGTSVSLSSDGNIIAIGGNGAGKDGQLSGNVRIYKNENDNWVQINEDIVGDNEKDYFGTSVSLSDDGNIIAVGATNYYFGTTSGSGYVKIYQNINNTWQLRSKIEGESLGDNFGSAVSLTSNGNIVAISAPLKDGVTLNTGQVRVYDLSAILSSDSFVLSKFTIFPNPAKNIVKIELKDNLQVDKISIFNSLGQFIKSSKELTIDTYNLSKGIYYLQIETDKGKASKKLVIE